MYHVWYKTSTPSTLSKWSPLLHCLTTFGKRAGNHAVLGTVTHSSAAKKVQFIWSFGATHSQSCWHDKPLKLTRRIVYYEEKKQFVFVCSKSLASFKIDPNGCKNWNDTVDTIVLGQWVYPVRLESKTGTPWNRVKNTPHEPRDWPNTNRTRFSEKITRVHL